MTNTYNSNINFGRAYDEFIIGDTYNHWPGKTITESDNNLFSLITMNHHPVHIDHNFAETHKHKKVLVVGTLVFSLVVGLTVRDISGFAIANLGYESINHLNPVFIGDTIYAESTIIDKQLTKSRKKGIVYVDTKAHNQNNIEVISFKRHFLTKLTKDFSS